MDDDLDSFLSDPGSYAAGAGFGDVSSLDGGDVADASEIDQTLNDVPNLTSNFSPNLANLESQITPMDDDDSDSIFTGLASGSVSDASSFNPSTLLSDFSGIGSSLLGAFVTNPANAATAEAQALETAGIQSALTSNIFTYLLIGLVIFLVFGFLDRKA